MSKCVDRKLCPEVKRRAAPDPIQDTVDSVPFVSRAEEAQGLAKCLAEFSQETDKAPCPRPTTHMFRFRKQTI
jgi:hypothetical protein